jgi:hypothetical protein
MADPSRGETVAWVGRSMTPASTTRQDRRQDSRPGSFANCRHGTHGSSGTDLERTLGQQRLSPHSFSEVGASDRSTLVLVHRRSHGVLQGTGRSISQRGSRCPRSISDLRLVTASGTGRPAVNPTRQIIGQSRVAARPPRDQDRAAKIAAAEVSQSPASGLASGGKHHGNMIIGCCTEMLPGHRCSRFRARLYVPCSSRGSF